MMTCQLFPVRSLRKTHENHTYTAVLPPKTKKNHTISTKHAPHVLIKKILTNSTTIAKQVPLSSNSSAHQVVKVKPKKTITRLKHKQLKHQRPGNVTIHSATQPATGAHNQIKILPAVASTNATKSVTAKYPKKYKLVKVIKRKRKEKQPVTVTIVTAPPTTQPPIITSNQSTIATSAAIYDSTTTTTTPHINSNIFRKLPDKSKSLNEAIQLISATALPGLNQTVIKVGDTPLSEAITMAAAGAAAGAAAAAAAAMSKDGKSLPQSLTEITRDALFKKILNGNGILSKINRSNITAATTNTTIPPINREILSCVSKERLAKSGLNMDLQKEIESHRFDSMLQRQRSAARQMRLANQISGNLMRENYDSELSDRLVESGFKRHDELRRQSKFREELRNRFNQLRMTFSDWT